MAKLTQTQVKKQIVKWKGSANHGYINIPKGVQGETIIVTNLYKKKETPIIALTKSHVLVMPKKWVGDRVEVDIYKQE